MYAEQGDVEQAKAHYLARFVHRDCGGVPVAYVEGSYIGCSRCRAKWDGRGPLGKAVERIKDFEKLRSE